LYRAEVAPFVDVMIDISASMTLTPQKAARTDELVTFCVECADRAGAPVRLHAVAGRTVRAVSAEEVHADRWRDRLDVPKAEGGAGSAGAPNHATSRGPSASSLEPAAPGPLHWRAGALKVLISDLLYPGDPSGLLVPLAASSGVGIILAPALADEADLPWRGNVELTDCESGAVRRQQIDDPLAERYRAAYARHFGLWREAARRRGVLFGRVPCEGALSHALSGEAFAAGAVEVVQ
jgi:hypothetical protein